MNISKQKGITLIETLIYIAIIGLIMTSFVSFAMNMSGNREKVYVISEVQHNLRSSVNIISKHLRESDGINIDDSTFGTDPGVLSLSKVDSEKDPTIISLNQDNGQLQIKEGTATTTKITSDKVKITNLSFDNFSTANERENIRFYITTEFNNQNQDSNYIFSQSATTTINLRK